MSLGWREAGVFWSIVIGESSAGLLAIWLFRKGNWKKVKV
jgi:Na+-driven multidrug efflux pump